MCGPIENKRIEKTTFVTGWDFFLFVEFFPSNEPPDSNAPRFGGQ